VLVFADRRPTLRVFRADAGNFELGRVELAVSDVLDGMISRKHARIGYDGEWLIEDLSSLNGTFVGGRRISGEARAASGTTIRLGGAVLLPVADVLPFEHYGAGVREGLVGGPGLRRALQIASELHAPDASLLIEGEIGTGKELVARAFHRAGPNPTGPFFLVDCATLQKDHDDTLLFGSSGAVSAPAAAAAREGTLFLDEVAELSSDLQAKLLGWLESRQASPSREPPGAPLRICAASFRHLRDEVSAGRFGHELYQRLARAELRLPTLRERLEEVPWHVQQLLEARAKGEQTLFPSASFMDACLSRVWPGNVRELCAEIERAVARAMAEGSRLLTAEDLSPTAGHRVPASKLKPVARFPEDDVAKALTLEAGNVLGAARRLGVHRNKVRRWLERHHVDAAAFKRRPSP
jgi:DNA-binding NtrC family response regulator